MESNFSALSPSVRKTWNKLVFKSRKSSYVQRQINNLKRHDSIESLNSIPSSAWSSERDESEYEFSNKQKRYATIRKMNEMKKSTIIKTRDYVNTEMRENLSKIQNLKSEMCTIQNEIKKSNNNYSNIFNDYDDDMFTLKTNLLKSLEIELNQIENQKLIKQTSTSSVSSCDSGVLSNLDEDETFFYKTTNFETLV